MISRSWVRGARSAAGVLVTLGLLALAAPTRAEAGCAHYAYAASSHDPMAATARLALLGLDHPDPVTPVRLPGGLPKPCSGLSCSGRPSQPLPLPAVSGAPRLDRWLCLTVTPAPQPPSGRIFTPPTVPARPTRAGDRVDRPPRPL
jgi:hypothetical protein